MMDYSLPGQKDGPTTAASLKRMLQKERPAEKLPYLCFVSAYAEKSFIEKAKKSGADSYLVKPIFR